MSTQTEHGYFVLADISGYTSYVAQTELEHSQEILSELLGVIVEHFKSMLTISKLEGDAIFANVNEAQVPRPEALLELIDNTYISFCQRRDSSQRRTTCACRACQAMATLELKFFLHYGDYIVQHISGIRELVGSDVNLIHRLTKNHISEATGWRAYLLMTRKALDCLALQMEGLHEQVESYEHLGDVTTYSLDIRARYQTLMDEKRTVITPEESDLNLSCQFDAPVALVWQFMTDPKILTQTMREGGQWTIIKRPGGRSGAGAQNHCAHGGGVMAYTYLDWRPFEYYTAEGVQGDEKHIEMFIVEPADEGRQTRFTIRIKMLGSLPSWIRKPMVSRMIKPQFLDFLDRSKKLLANFQAPPS